MTCRKGPLVYVVWGLYTLPKQALGWEGEYTVLRFCWEWFESAFLPKRKTCYKRRNAEECCLVTIVVWAHVICSDHKSGTLFDWDCLIIKAISRVSDQVIRCVKRTSLGQEIWVIHLQVKWMSSAIEVHIISFKHAAIWPFTLVKHSWRYTWIDVSCCHSDHCCT